MKLTWENLRKSKEGEVRQEVKRHRYILQHSRSRKGSAPSAGALVHISALLRFLLPDEQLPRKLNRTSHLKLVYLPCFFRIQIIQGIIFV